MADDYMIVKYPGQDENLAEGRLAGPCGDRTMLDQTTLLDLRRYARGMFKFTLAAGPGSDLVLAPESQVQLFTKGVGESGADAGMGDFGNLTDADTDAYRQGALARKGNVFGVQAIGFTPEMPLARAQNNAQSYPAWLANPTYIDRLVSSVFDQASVIIQFADDKCQYELGVLGRWPASDGLGHSRTPTNAYPQGLANMIPFRVVNWTGARDDSDQMNVFVTVPRGIVIGNDAINPTQSDVYVPFRMEMLGFPRRRIDLCGAP